MLNYNVLMLACLYGSVAILDYLVDDVIGRSADPEERKDQLLTARRAAEGQVGIQAIHLACFFGEVDVLTALHK